MSANSQTAPSDHVVGVLGLGAMGGPMARHLLAAGYPVHVHDLDPAALDAAPSTPPPRWAPSPRAVPAHSARTPTSCW
jgi:3-hydroxyisobutyrate dehydrogenase-like beta-hydroxyacid dehydrogenase